MGTECRGLAAWGRIVSWRVRPPAEVGRRQPLGLSLQEQAPTLAHAPPFSLGLWVRIPGRPCLLFLPRPRENPLRPTLLSRTGHRSLFPAGAFRSPAERLVPSCSELSSPGAHTQSLQRPQSWGCPQPRFPKNVNPSVWKPTSFSGWRTLSLEDGLPSGRPGDFSAPATWGPAGATTSQEEPEGALQAHLGPATCIWGRRVGSFLLLF